LVGLAGVVEHAVRVDRDVAGVPSVGEPDSSDDREGNEGTEEDL